MASYQVLVEEGALVGDSSAPSEPPPPSLDLAKRRAEAKLPRDPATGMAFGAGGTAVSTSDFECLGLGVYSYITHLLACVCIHIHMYTYHSHRARAAAAARRRRRQSAWTLSCALRQAADPLLHRRVHLDAKKGR